MRLIWLIVVGISFLAVSCRPQKLVVSNYLMNISDTTIKDSLPVPKLVIRKNDILTIKVYSTAMGLNPAADAPYNLPEQGAGTGFLVDNNGNIEYPQIGGIHVEGMTKEELAETIKKKLEGQLNQPSVIVRFANFHVTVLGEVGHPATITLPTEKVTILEALGMAGDISEFGRKDNVKVIREVNGEKQIGTIDLTSHNMFNSPYFQLQQNDYILVDQATRKLKQQNQQNVAQQIAFGSSILTAIALILNLSKF
jgi:polysaccharide export outer membrane protein